MCPATEPLYCHQVDIWWGDAVRKVPEVAAKKGRIDFLLLDGTPKETLAYLEAAEPHLAPGAMVVADNAGAVPLPKALSCACKRVRPTNGTPTFGAHAYENEGIDSGKKQAVLKTPEILWLTFGGEVLDLCNQLASFRQLMQGACA